MSELSRCLFVAGGVPFVALGLAHAWATPLRVGEPKGLAPSDTAVFLVGRSGPSFGAEGALFGPLAVVVSSGYLLLALRYWFRTPIVGCGVSVALFLAS